MTTSARNVDLSLLRQVPLFARLDDSMLEQLAGCSRRRQMRADVTVFLMGDQGHTLFIIISGTVRLERATLAGRTIQLAQRGAGQHFGEMAILDGKPRMADAITATPCEFLILEREDFLRCLAQSPQIAVSVIASLAERLREAADQQEHYQGQDVMGRLCAALLAQAETAPAERDGQTAPLQISYPRQDLAERIGATPESVSRAITSLCDARIVEKQGRSILRIVSLAKLRKRADRSS